MTSKNNSMSPDPALCDRVSFKTSDPIMADSPLYNVVFFVFVVTLSGLENEGLGVLNVDETDVEVLKEKAAICVKNMAPGYPTRIKITTRDLDELSDRDYQAAMLLIQNVTKQETIFAN